MHNARVVDYLVPQVFTAHPEESLATCESRMRERGVSSLLVVGVDGRAAGVLTRSDLLRLGHVYATAMHETVLATLPTIGVGDAMTWRVCAVAPSTSLADAARRMVENRVHRLYVLVDERPVGVLGTREIMRAVLDDKLAAPLATFMSAPVVRVQTTDSLELAVDRLERGGISGLVVSEGDQPVGIFTLAEALEARARSRATPVEEAMSQALLCLPSSTPLHRAAGFTLSTRARRIVCVEHHHVCGVATGLDFARALAGRSSGPLAEVVSA